MSQVQQAVLDPREAITAANGRFMSSLSRQDATALAAMYTDEGQVLAPGTDVVQGRVAIEQFFRGAMAAGIRGINLETVEVDVRETMAIEIGRFVLRGQGGVEIDRGKYVVIWNREDGVWKLHRDLWNSSVPPAESSARSGARQP